MTEPNLVALSLSAFLAVMVVLSFLALAIRTLAFAFRERGPSVAAPAGTASAAPRHPQNAAERSDGDAALVAALHAAIARHHPGARVVRIDETTPRRAS